MAKAANNSTSNTMRQVAADPRGQPPQRPQGPRAIAPGAGPQGQKLAGNLGPGTLRPGAGKQVQRSGEPLYCGTISGRVFGFTDHPNNKDMARTSTRFAGQFLLVDHTGVLIHGAECYLPGTITRAVKAALGLQGGEMREPVAISLEVWCEPDQEGRPASPLGYSYVCYDRRAMRDNDPLLAIAYEAGILERPDTAPAALAGPAMDPDVEVDPETGELTRKAPAPSQAA
jgi:hypothetical protein